MTRLREPGLIGVAVDPSSSRGDQAVGLAQLADAHHADLVTVNDEPYIAEHLEAWTLLATLAARTEHIAVTPNVAALALRPPAMLAKAAASLQVLSGGRVVLGLGAGGPLDDIAAFGGARRTVGESVAALEEAIRLIRRLWTPGQDPAPHSGRFYQHGGLPLGPVPTRPVPIWTGAFGPRMLTLTGQLADGWLPTNYFLDLADVPAMQERIDTAATQAGRDPSQIRRVFNVMGAITDTGPTENRRSLIGPRASGSTRSTTISSGWASTPSSSGPPTVTASPRHAGSSRRSARTYPGHSSPQPGETTNAANLPAGAAVTERQRCRVRPFPSRRSRRTQAWPVRGR